MSRIATSKLRRKPSDRAERVGTAEFRRNLATYLKRADTGVPVIIQDRGRDAYLLSRIEDEERDSVVGGMRERTEYTPGTVVNALERWRPGEMP